MAAPLFVDAAGRLRLVYQVWNAPYTSYPTDPNCDRAGPLCLQGQRFLPDRRRGRLGRSPHRRPDRLARPVSACRRARSTSAAGPSTRPTRRRSPSTSTSTASARRSPPAARARPRRGLPRARLRPRLRATDPGGARHPPGVRLRHQRRRRRQRRYRVSLGLRAERVAVRHARRRSVSKPGGVARRRVGHRPRHRLSPIAVHVYVDGAGTALTAGDARPDLAAASTRPAARTTGSRPPSPRRVRHPQRVRLRHQRRRRRQRRCSAAELVIVPGGSPYRQPRRGPGRARRRARSAAGRSTLTPSAPIAVHVYVDGEGVATIADASRSDVGAAFRPTAPAHGFGATVGATPGLHTVCAYGINVGLGGNSLLGCRTVDVPDTSPFGSLDAVSPLTGAVFVGGLGDRPRHDRPDRRPRLRRRHRHRPPGRPEPLRRRHGLPGVRPDPRLRRHHQRPGRCPHRVCLRHQRRAADRTACSAAAPSPSADLAAGRTGPGRGTAPLGSGAVRVRGVERQLT